MPHDNRWAPPARRNHPFHAHHCRRFRTSGPSPEIRRRRFADRELLANSRLLYSVSVSAFIDSRTPSLTTSASTSQILRQRRGQSIEHYIAKCRRWKRSNLARLWPNFDEAPTELIPILRRSPHAGFMANHADYMPGSSGPYGASGAATPSIFP